MNEFTERYLDILTNNNQFTKHTFNNYSIYKYQPNKQEINLSLLMAQKKAPYLMKHSQNGSIRGKYKIINKAFQGMLAEYVVHKFIIDILNVNITDVERYDIVRESFESNFREEYDLRISFNDNEYKNIEVRSSISNYDVNYIIDNYHLIGPYHNEYKGSYEKIADMYIRPIYVNNNNVKINDIGLANALYSDDIELYIFTGSLKKDFEKLCKEYSFNQYSTKYLGVVLKEIGDIDNFIENFNNIRN